MPPVGPGTSLMTIPFLSVVCSVMPLTAGGTACAPAPAPRRRCPSSRRPRSGSPGRPARTRSTRPTPIGGTVNTPVLMPATGTHGIAQVGMNAGDVGHHHLDAADLHRVDVVDDRAAVLAVERCASLMSAPTGRVEIRPLRASENDCLYSPRSISWVTRLDVVEAVERQAGAAHADELARLEHAAVARDVERAGAEHRVAVLAGVGEARHQRLRRG